MPNREYVQFSTLEYVQFLTHVLVGRVGSRLGTARVLRDEVGRHNIRWTRALWASLRYTAVHVLTVDYFRVDVAQRQRMVVRSRRSYQELAPPGVLKYTSILH